MLCMPLYGSKSRVRPHGSQTTPTSLVVRVTERVRLPLPDTWDRSTIQTKVVRLPGPRGAQQLHVWQSSYRDFASLNKEAKCLRELVGHPVPFCTGLSRYVLSSSGLASPTFGYLRPKVGRLVAVSIGGSTHARNDLPFAPIAEPSVDDAERTGMVFSILISPS